MTSLFKPCSSADYVIGRGEAFFVQTPEREISRRRRRRLRGKRKAGLLPPWPAIELGDFVFSDITFHRVRASA